MVMKNQVILECMHFQIQPLNYSSKTTIADKLLVFKWMKVVYLT